ncbi:hypothetical protein, partial [Alkalibacillus haloalkaliphilus]|uniref:hypothetical protein n=1 Tax=Alkalibacillus haloalkaliphilus TaxID=94136 RepID=UPI0029355F6A
MHNTINCWYTHLLANNVPVPDAMINHLAVATGELALSGLVSDMFGVSLEKAPTPTAHLNPLQGMARLQFN